MIKVGLLDKNELFRESLHFLIDSNSRLEINYSTNSFSHLLGKLTPGLLNALIVDINGVSKEEISILNTIIHQFPEVKIIILTDIISKGKVTNFISYGISAYFSKNIQKDILLKRIVEITTSESHIGVLLGEHVKETILNAELISPNNSISDSFFTTREIEVLRLICLEYKSAEIAEILNVGVRTIETHRKRMIQRTGSKSIIGVILYALSEESEALIKVLKFSEKSTPIESQFSKLFNN